MNTLFVLHGIDWLWGFVAAFVLGLGWGLGNWLAAWLTRPRPTRA